jgi:iron(III) transport system permease protein
MQDSAMSTLKRRAPALVALTIAALVAAPALLTLAAFADGGAAPAGLAAMTATTLTLAAATALIAIVFGVAAALLVGLCDFPGRRIMAVALAAPLAVPAYVAIYAYSDALSPFGTVASLLGAERAPFGARNFWGAAIALGATSYPYVYLAARAALATRSAAMFEAARTLGASPMRAMAMIVAPGLRPAIAGGAALVMMETAADFGVADYSGLSTLGVGIFRAWYGLGDLAGATRVAGVLFLVALLLALFEERARRGSASDAARAMRAAERLRLSPAAVFLAICVCASPVLLGFIAPVAQLLFHVSSASPAPLLEAARNTVLIALPGALLVVAIAMFLAAYARAARGSWPRAFIRMATIGYAIPGAVIAMGVLAFAGKATGAAALLYAYAARFTTAGFNAIAGGAAAISPTLDEAARTLGATPLRVASAIHAPLLRRSIAAAAIIVFVDIVKELPATLILRSFNFETLATATYRFASDERLAEASPAALALIAAGLLPVALLERAAR